MDNDERDDTPEGIIRHFIGKCEYAVTLHRMGKPSSIDNYEYSLESIRETKDLLTALLVLRDI